MIQFSKFWTRLLTDFYDANSLMEFSEFKGLNKNSKPGNICYIDPRACPESFKVITLKI